MHKQHLKNIIGRLASITQPKSAAFVFGCQRSGTGLMLAVLQKSLYSHIYPEENTEVYAYADTRVYSAQHVAKLTKSSHRPVTVFKPLNDSQLAHDLLDTVKNSKAIWMYRDYRDVINSGLAKWQGGWKIIIEAIANDDLSDPINKMYTEKVPDGVLNVIRSFKDQKLTNHDGAALLWYLRNKLYFELNLDDHDDILLVNYEKLVSSPEAEFGEVFRHFGLPFSQRYTSNVHSSSIRKNSHPDFHPKVKSLCDELMESLDHTHIAQGAGSGYVNDSFSAASNYR